MPNKQLADEYKKKKKQKPKEPDLIGLSENAARTYMYTLRVRVRLSGNRN